MARQNIILGGYTFKTLKSPRPTWTEVPNTIWRKTADGGKERAVKFGGSVDRFTYTIWLQTATDLSNWTALLTALSDLSTTVAMTDHRGTSYTAVRMLGYQREDDENDEELVSIELLEVLT